MSLYNDAKLILTPNAYKEGVLYTLKPTPSTVGNFDVVRATSATRVNENGLIENVGNDIARLDYTNGEASVLVEPQRTNLLLNSVFENNGTDITSFNRTILGTPTYSFYNYNVGEGLNINGVSDQRLHFSRSTAVTSGQIYTISCSVEVVSGAPIIRDVLFPTSIPIDETRVNGVVVSELDTIGVGVYLIEMNITTTSTSQVFRIGLGAALTLSYSAHVKIQEPQLEEAASATSYIPTTSSTVTRNADVNTVTPPTGTTEITEYFEDGTTNVITSIPATYTIPNGRISKIIML